MSAANKLTKSDTRALWHAVDAMKYSIIGMRELEKEEPGKFTPEQIQAEEDRLEEAKSALRKVQAIRRTQP